MSATKTMPDLSMHTGSGEFYRNTLSRKFINTEGVQDMVTQCKAFWLLDLVMSHLPKRHVGCEHFQLWSIRMLPASAQNKAIVECRTDTNGRVLCSQLLPYTDFPLNEGETFEWYVIANELGGFTMLLKSEY